MDIHNGHMETPEHWPTPECTHQLSLPNYKHVAETLYELCHQLSPTAQTTLYRQPLETLLEQLNPKLQTWVQCDHFFFNQQQLKAAKTQAALQTPDIHKFSGIQTQQTDNLQPPWETMLHCTSVGLLCTEITIKILSF